MSVFFLPWKIFIFRHRNRAKYMDRDKDLQTKETKLWLILHTLYLSWWSYSYIRDILNQYGSKVNQCQSRSVLLEDKLLNSMYQIVWTRLVHTQKTISPHTVAASVSILMRFRFSEKGILFFVISFSHLLSNRLRKFWLNGPKYERKPVAINTSPTSLEVNKPTNIHSNTFLYLTHIHQISKDFSARSKIIYERLRGRQRKMCKLNLNSSNQMTATQVPYIRELFFIECCEAKNSDRYKNLSKAGKYHK